MPLAGNQLDTKNALAICYARGFRGMRRLVTAASVMTAESARYVKAYHENLDEKGNLLSTDRGLFQINDKSQPEYPADDMLKAKPNVDAAFVESKGGDDWTPWAAYNSGRYLLFVPEFTAVWALQTWRSRVERWTG